MYCIVLNKTLAEIAQGGREMSERAHERNRESNIGNTKGERKAERKIKTGGTQSESEGEGE